MEEKINIAKLLKDCPTGMELDCACADNVVFDKIIEYEQIKCVIGESREPLILDKYGRLLHICCPKCVIFPKGKTTWEGFKRPFKDGDIAVSDIGGIHLLRTADSSYCAYREYWEGLPKFDNTLTTSIKIVRLATEEEKEKLFNAIKANGYKWNPETKTLEKLIEPKFKVGDKIKKKKDYISGVITDISDGTYRVEYKSGGVAFANITFQDDWELVPNKFDITTLKSFESRVLVRSSMDGLWKPAVFGFRNGYNDNAFYIVGGSCWKQCIPYLNNEHLCGTTDDCDEYYKTWE